jgi:hypothetical protein
MPRLERENRYRWWRLRFQEAGTLLWTELGVVGVFLLTRPLRAPSHNGPWLRVCQFIGPVGPVYRAFILEGHPVFGIAANVAAASPCVLLGTLTS